MNDFSIPFRSRVDISEGSYKVIEKRDYNQELVDFLSDNFRSDLDDEELVFFVSSLDDFLKRHRKVYGSILQSGDVLIDFLFNKMLYFHDMSNSSECLYSGMFVKCCRILAFFLKKKIYPPSVLVQHQIRSFIAKNIRSPNDDFATGAAYLFSEMVVPEEDPDPSFVQRYFAFSHSFNQTFSTFDARECCLRFFKRVVEKFGSINQLTPDNVSSMNITIRRIFRNDELAPHRPSAVSLLRKIITICPQFIPQCFRTIQMALSFINEVDNDDLVNSILLLISSIFCQDIVPLDNFLPVINFSTLISQLTTLSSKVNYNALWAIIDISSQGPHFIAALYDAGLLDFFDMEFEELTLRMKCDANFLIFNLFTVGNAPECAALFVSNILQFAVSALSVATQSQQKKFVFGLATAIEKFEEAGYLDICNRPGMNIITDELEYIDTNNPLVEAKIKFIINWITEHQNVVPAEQ